MATKPHIVIVIGMHRSGTSLAAEMLTRLGAWTRDRLLEANEFNPRGYWEDADLVGLHDTILATLDRSWGGIRASLPMPDGWLDNPAITEPRRELEAFIRAGVEAANGTPWMVKDPRVCRLLPLWQAIADDCGIRLAGVLCARAPDAVAASLEKRDDLPRAFGRLLWLVNNVDALTAGRDLVGASISYDRWFTAPATQAAILAAAIGRTLSGAELAAATGVVSDTLRHHDSILGHGMADQLYRQLDLWAEEGERPAALDDLADCAVATLADVAPWIESTNDPEYLRDNLEVIAKEYRVAYHASAAKCAELETENNRLRSLVWRFERPLGAVRSLRRAIRPPVKRTAN
ncbi:sulfotransferase family protein [Microbaculum marinisediminis]|uniref:Sulfotransferase family protein n=1 Tax=Microbaculum marinisediminis TaxID=2931392 RepID=A0AAW5R5F9_9HYPH|nr:hypothetical protein [Microbaculum sp. A6E488]MCT8974617.1 hypothetical protein [Microbaculum sp. A6E488]